MKQLLKFNKALGYHKDGTLIVELKDGRYALIETQKEKAPDKYCKGYVGTFKESFLRGKEITENIPEDLIIKAKNILNNPNSKIRISNI